MHTDAFSQRFDGCKRLYGEDTIDFLQQAHVCVAGIGGVGSWAAEALARTGVGNISLIDLDDICVTNTNRQIHTLTSTIGKSKITVMAERIRAINPDCTVCCIDDFVEKDNISTLIPNNINYVLDAIDSFRVKAALIAHCKRNKIKVITVGASGGKKDPTKIQTADLSLTFQDPLARKTREHLKRFYGLANNSKKRFYVDCVFSSEAIQYPQSDGSVCARKPGTSSSMKMDCAQGLGATTVVTATFGFVAVAKIIEKLNQYNRSNS